MSGPVPDTGAAIQVLHLNSTGDRDTARVNPNLVWTTVRATLVQHVKEPLAYFDCFV